MDNVTPSPPEERGIDRVRAAAEENGFEVLGNRDDDFKVQHEGERTPSLHVTDKGEGRVVLHCFHCDEDQKVLAAYFGLTEEDLFDNRKDVRYPYPDGRVVHRKPGKQFHQTGNTKGTALYRRDEVAKAVREGRTVHVVEGEKDVHAVEAAGEVATCSAGGARKWDKADPSPLYDAVEVVVVQDKDEAGAAHAKQVIESLRHRVKALRLGEAKTGKDAADHLLQHKLDEFVPVELPTPDRWSRITWASEIEPAPVVWAWRYDGHGRIPSSALTLAAGREGTGKSSWGIWLAAKISRGALPGEFLGRPRRVLYVAVKDSWEQTIVPRLMAAGADLTMIGRFDVISFGEEVALSLPTDNAMLERMAAEYDVALIVVDPLMSAIGQGIDTHVEREVRLALEPLAALARRVGLMLLGIAHFNKSSGSDLNNLITGSGAFKNVARAVLGFAHDEEGGVMTQAKNSLGRGDLPSLGYVLEAHEIDTRKGKAETSRFRFTGTVDRTVRDVLNDARGDSSERSEADHWLKDYLIEAGGEVSAHDVIEAAEVAGFTADRIKKSRIRIKADTRREGFGKDSRYWWSLPMDAPMDAMDAGARPPESMGTHGDERGDNEKHCTVCEQHLMHPKSKARGMCERCRIDNEKKESA